MILYLNWNIAKMSTFSIGFYTNNNMFEVGYGRVQFNIVFFLFDFILMNFW